jgi:hypothetical protein
MTSDLFNKDLKVINVGVPSFADSISESGGDVQHIDWKPPAQADRETGLALAKLINHPDIEAANQIALERYQAVMPVLKDIQPARDVIPGLGEKTILHAGPPVEWARMCGPMQGAVAAAILIEGWASGLDAAEKLAASGTITYAPCHHYQSVGPMAGIISPSMPVWVIEDSAYGGRAFSTLNEGRGKALRFGANDPAVIDRWKWMNTVMGPLLGKAIRVLGGVELKPMMAQALHMGDELHNRNVAASALLFKHLAPAMLKTDAPQADIAEVLEFSARNELFFLNPVMASCKLMLDAAHNVPHSTMVTVMARNGVEFGIRVSGAGDRWFTAPAPIVDALYFPGYGPEDAAPDLGDSAITETAGLGGFAMAAAPAVVQFVGGTAADAIAYTQEMGHITLGVSNSFTLPPLAFAGSPIGIDARKVVDTGITPVINTGVAHRKAGMGQVGGGLTRAPLECFSKAVSYFASTMEL